MRTVDCQIDGCAERISDKAYFKRYKICLYHFNLPSMVLDGRPVRWCQQARAGERAGCGAGQICLSLRGPAAAASSSSGPALAFLQCAAPNLPTASAAARQATVLPVAGQPKNPRRLSLPLQCGRFQPITDFDGDK